MKSYLTVLKLLIRNMFLPDKTKDSKRGAKIAAIIVCAVAYLFLAAFLVFMVLMLSLSFRMLGLINEFITAIWSMASVMVLIFGIISMLSYLYFSRDTEFFLALPIKPSVIYLAKFTIVYLTELIVAALLLIPALITTGVITGASAAYYIISLFGIVFAPSLPLMLASIIAIPLMYIVSFFKNKGALSSIVLILLFGLFFALYFLFISKMSSFNPETDDPNLIVEKFRGLISGAANAVYPFLALSRASTLTPTFGLSAGVSALVNFLIFFGCVAVLISISVVITSLVYKRGAASQMENVKKKSTGKEKFVSSSSLKALVKKEWRELIRTPTFAYQCLATVVMTPLLVAIFSFMGMADASVTVDGEEIAAALWSVNAVQWFMSFGFMIMFGIGFNVASSTAITREGMNFYFSKQMPVPYKTQIKAKKILCMIISLISCVIGLILLTVATKDFVNAFIGLVFTLMYSYGFICFAIYHDLKKPKLDWAIPNEAVKQNFRIMVPYFLNIVFAVISMVAPIVVIVFIPSPTAAYSIIWGVIFAVGLAITIASHILLEKNTDRLYAKLSV